MKKKIISALVLIIVALAAILPVMWYSNCFESFSPLYVLYEGKEVGELVIEQSSADETTQTRFEVKSAGFKPGAIDYSVRIIPNEENDFGYLSDGKMYLFSRAGELTEYFDIELHESYFILSGVSGQYSLNNVLSAVRGGSAVTLPNNVEDGKANYYTLEVIGNGQTVKINLRFEFIKQTGVIDLILDTPGIIF